MISLDQAYRTIVVDILRQAAQHRRAYVFGSRATGKAKPTSDLDIALVGNEPLGLDAMGRLKNAFSESDLPFRVDIVDVATVADDFRRTISAEWQELDLGAN